jgi:hypothetical protein
MKSFNVLLTTIGRAELSRMLDSLVNQLSEIDYLTIVSDMNHDYVRDIINLYDWKCTVLHIANNTALGFWGHGSRNKWQNSLPGDFILNADDDDRYTEWAFEYIRNYVVEDKLYLFKHQNNGGTAWASHEIRIGNIGTSCGVIPNNHNLPDWGYFYGGDGEFYVKLSQMIPYEFIDCIIYKVRDTE